MFNLIKSSRDPLKRVSLLSDELLPLENLLDEFSRFHGISPLNTLNTVSFSPPIEVTAHKDKYLVTAELPGLTEKDVEITVTDDNTIIITGEKKEEYEKEEENSYVKERRYGAFRREIPFSNNIVLDNIDATFKDGILSLSIPKKEEEEKPKSKKIEIKT